MIDCVVNSCSLNCYGVCAVAAARESYQASRKEVEVEREKDMRPIG